MNKEEFEKKIEDIEHITKEDVQEFVNEIDFDGEYDRLYLAYLMQNGNYQPEGNLTLDQIYSMNNLDLKMTIEDLNCLQSWEMEEMNTYFKKQKESASIEQIEEISGVCMGIAKTLGEEESFDGWFDDDEKNEKLIQNYFEESGLSEPFMEIKEKRDEIKNSEIDKNDIYETNKIKNDDKELEMDY